MTRADSLIRGAGLTPNAVSAGDSVEFSIRLELLPGVSLSGNRLVLDLPATLGMSRPSCHNQEDDGYVAVFCSNPDIRYRKGCYNVELLTFISRETRKTNMDTDGAKRFFVLDFLDGATGPGDQLVLKWGYVRGGMGCGTKVTTNITSRDFQSLIDVRYFRDGERAFPDLGHDTADLPRPVPDQQVALPFRVLPREPCSLRLLHTRRDSRLLVLDRFHNVCDRPDIPALIEGETDGTFSAEGAYVFHKRLPAIQSRDLPIARAPDLRDVYEGMHIYVGDLHTHSMWSNDCCEREKMQVSPAQIFRNARDVAGFDFLAVTDHHQPWDEERNRIGEAGWEDLRAAAREFTDESFLALVGFEFRDDRGDTPVVFADPPDYGVINSPGLTDIRALWQAFRGMDYLCIPHLHNRGSLPDGVWYQCPDEGVEPILDVYSCHGSYEFEGALERGLPEVKRTRPDRFVQWFLQQGYHYGHSCNSDDHMGHPGTCGTLCVYSPALTRQDLFAAIRGRHCYGTTGARIRLLFTACGRLMGSVLPEQAEKFFRIEVAGEAPFKAVDLIRNGELYRRFKPNAIRYETELTVAEEGPSNWYVRAIQLDNQLAYSSPVWFESPTDPHAGTR